MITSCPPDIIDTWLQDYIYDGDVDIYGDNKLIFFGTQDDRFNEFHVNATSKIELQVTSPGGTVDIGGGAIRVYDEDFAPDYMYELPTIKPPAEAVLISGPIGDEQTLTWTSFASLGANEWLQDKAKQGDVQALLIEGHSQNIWFGHDGTQNEDANGNLAPIGTDKSRFNNIHLEANNNVNLLSNIELRFKSALALFDQSGIFNVNADQIQFESSRASFDQSGMFRVEANQIHFFPESEFRVEYGIPGQLDFYHFPLPDHTGSDTTNPEPSDGDILVYRDHNNKRRLVFESVMAENTWLENYLDPGNPRTNLSLPSSGSKTLSLGTSASRLGDFQSWASNNIIFNSATQITLFSPQIVLAYGSSGPRIYYDYDATKNEGEVTFGKDTDTPYFSFPNEKPSPNAGLQFLGTDGSTTSLSWKRADFIGSKHRAYDDALLIWLAAGGSDPTLPGEILTDSSILKQVSYIRIGSSGNPDNDFGINEFPDNTTLWKNLYLIPPPGPLGQNTPPHWLITSIVPAGPNTTYWQLNLMLINPESIEDLWQAPSAGATGWTLVIN